MSDIRTSSQEDGLSLQVVLSALILSECVYKLVDIGDKEAAKAASGFVAQLPPGLVSLQHMQSADSAVPQRSALHQSVLSNA